MLNNRNNAREFAGACTQGKNIYNVFNTWIALNETDFLQRLNKTSVQVIKLGAGFPGFRNWELHNQYSMFNHYRVNNRSFKDVFFQEVTTTITVSPCSVNLIWPDFNLIDFKQESGATDMRFFVASLMKSNAAWDGVAMKYLPVDPTNELQFNQIQYSVWFPIDSSLKNSDIISCYDGTIVPTSDDSIIGVIGIQYAKQVNGNYNIFYSKTASEIFQIFPCP